MELLTNTSSWEFRVLLDLLISLLLTGIIGWEREMGDKPAGIKTNIFVGMAATLLVAIGKALTQDYANMEPTGAVTADPLRLIQAIVIGVSFIGGGTILKSPKHERVRYLTSAATILLSAGVGVAVAAHDYILATGITIMVFAINLIVGKLENRMGKERD